MKKGTTTGGPAVRLPAQLSAKLRRCSPATIRAVERYIAALGERVTLLVVENLGLNNQLRATSLDVRTHFDRAAELEKTIRGGGEPVPMRLTCPACGDLHVDEGEFASKPHHTHACQRCGNVWRPAVVPTVGVRFLPGFKDDQRKDPK